MTLPLRIVQASATAAAEQPRAVPILAQAWDHAADWRQGRQAARCVGANSATAPARDGSTRLMPHPSVA